MSVTTGRIATVSVDVGDQEIVFETGKLAKQADGAVVCRSGETMILATAVGRPDSRPDADFFPLTVDVEERMYAAGKIPGGFFKREGRATERATLTARMIDRPIRPLWPKGFRNEVHIVCTTLSADLVTPHDVLCINGASAALMVSPLPFLGPIGAVRIGRVEGELVVNPSLDELEGSSLDLIVVGTREALTMVEAGGDQIPEDDDPRGARPGALGDPQDLRRARGPAGAGRQAEVGRRRPHGRARRRARVGGGSGDRRARAPRGRDCRRRARRGVFARDLDGLDGRRHDEARTGPRGLRVDPREGAPGRRRRAGPRAVPLGAPRADRRRAGLEGAPLREA